VKGLILAALLAAPEAPSSRAPWLPYAAATLATGLAAASAVLWRRRVRSLAAHERAFATLEQARAIADPRAFATVVSGAVRRYVEERFGIPAGRRTTVVLLEAGTVASLGALLDLPDRARSLAPADLEGMRACAWNFVATTRSPDQQRERTGARAGFVKKDPQQDGQPQQKDQQQAGHDAQQPEDRQQAGQRFGDADRGMTREWARQLLASLEERERGFALAAQHETDRRNW
jgi:hypothetical protein